MRIAWCAQACASKDTFSVALSYCSGSIFVSTSVSAAITDVSGVGVREEGGVANSSWSESSPSSEVGECGRGDTIVRFEGGFEGQGVCRGG